MKLEISRDDLLHPLQQVIGAIEKRQTLAALGHVLMEASESQLRLTATDLELTLVTTIEHVAQEAGQIAVPARKLYDICRALSDGSTLSISVENQKMSIKSGRSRFTLACLSASDFPKLEDISPTREVRLSAAVLKHLLDKTAFAMANQDVRYYLNGLLLEVAQNHVRAVATDGHRLSMCDAAMETGSDETTRIIVPRKAISELSRLLQDADLELAVQMSNNHIRLTAGHLEFTSKLIDGRFPDYERVLPEGNDSIMLADCNALRQTLQRASILSNEKYRGIKLQLSKNQLNIQSNNTEHEEAEDEIEVEYTGNEFEVGFNVQYIIEVLNTIDGELAKIRFKDPNSSILITDAEHEDARYVVMPMRL